MLPQGATKMCVGQERIGELAQQVGPLEVYLKSWLSSIGARQILGVGIKDDLQQIISSSAPCADIK